MTSNSIAKDLAIKIIKKEEGWREKPYHCSEGFLTVGWGRKISNIKNAPIPAIAVNKKEEEKFLVDNVEFILDSLEKRFKAQWLNIGNTRKAVMVSMVYQLGLGGFIGFKNMLKAIDNLDFNTAAKEMLDSKAAKQVPNRFRRNANMMISDSLDVYYGD